MHRVGEYLITPGAIDLHTHLREPGDNPAETIASGTRAALLGGFVLVSDMPNNPGMPVWDRERLIRKQEIAEETAWIPTAFYAGSQPESDNIGELARMAPHAVGLKLYGDPTTGNVNTYEAQEFRGTIAEWHRVAPEKPIMFHSGENNLVDMIQLVAGQFEHPLHICHVNSPEQVEIVDEAKEMDMPVTCGVCPHHLLMTSHHELTHGAFAEVKPGLAHQTEAEELLYLLEEGHIDVIETDFAPHSVGAKLQAEHSGGHCYGMPGIEHVMSVLFYLAHKGHLSWDRLEQATHIMPAAILGISFENTQVTWNMEDKAYRIGEDDVKAQCGWSPYIGMFALGKLDAVSIGSHRVVEQGLLIHKHPEIVEKRGQEVF